MPITENTDYSEGQNDQPTGKTGSLMAGALEKLRLDSSLAPIGQPNIQGDSLAPTTKFSHSAGKMNGPSEYQQFIERYRSDNLDVADKATALSAGAIGLRGATMYMLTNPKVDAVLRHTGEAGVTALTLVDIYKACSSETTVPDASGNFKGRSQFHNIAALGSDILLNVGMTRYTPKASLYSSAPLLLGLALRTGVALYPEQSGHK